MESPPPQNKRGAARVTTPNDTANSSSISTPSIPQPAEQSNAGPAADQCLAEYILKNHVRGLRDGFEHAFIKSLAMVKGDLSPLQSSALGTIWTRLQNGKAVWP